MGTVTASSTALRDRNLYSLTGKSKKIMKERKFVQKTIFKNNLIAFPFSFMV